MTQVIEVPTTSGTQVIQSASSVIVQAGAALTFKTLQVAGQSDVVADSAADILTLIAGANVTITTNAAGDQVTIASAAGITDGDKGDITVSGSGATWTIDPGTITLAKMANVSSGSIIGRQTAGNGAPELLTAANVKSLLSLGATDTATFLAIILSGQSLTGSQATSALDISTTWNTTGTPTAAKINVTDTASNAASLIQDWQVGGSSRMNLAKTGVLTVGHSSIAGVGNVLNLVTSYGTSALRVGGGGEFIIDNHASITGRLVTYSFLAFGSGADIQIYRDAADSLALRRGTNAQSLAVYNAYTDASNYDRARMYWSSNVLKISTEKAGTYTTQRAIEIDAGTYMNLNLAGANKFGIGGSTNVSYQELQVNGAVFAQVNITASTAGSGAPNAIIYSDSRKTYTNEGSTAKNYHNLPSAAAGYDYTFVVQDADGMQIVAAAGDTIRDVGTVSAAAGYIESTTIGSVVRLRAINATEWIAVELRGTWSIV